jgi:hypothetical protein
VTSAFSILGLALGALISGALLDYAPGPTELIWWALLGVFAAGVVAVLAVAEPGSRRPGVLSSLRPRVAMPRAARATFAVAIPCYVAVWAFGGLFLSLGPSLVAAAIDSPNAIWGGLVIFLLYGTGTATIVVFRNVRPRTAMLSGCWFLLAGVASTFVAIATTTSAALFVGTALAGLGVGLGFMGAFRMITSLASPDERAGLVAATFVMAYLAFSVPALVAGVATANFGLRASALVYCAALVVVTAAAGSIVSRRPTQNASRLTQAKPR